uniref:Uncharacterized protein n=1 Tax=Aegilops tauschii subsp. strangulata TaxID=200361 RepID=A0A453N6M4_AEGTS
MMEIEYYYTTTSAGVLLFPSYYYGTTYICCSCEQLRDGQVDRVMRSYVVSSSI